LSQSLVRTSRIAAGDLPQAVWRAFAARPARFCGWSFRERARKSVSTLRGVFTLATFRALKRSRSPMATGASWTCRTIGVLKICLRAKESPVGAGLELIVHGAQQECDIWVNGTHVAFQPHGYVPACVEVGPHLRPRPEPNSIAIRVVNPERNSRWYSGSGLYRCVSLRGHECFVPAWGAFHAVDRCEGDALACTRVEAMPTPGRATSEVDVN
jgi:hypothetical protein